MLVWSVTFTPSEEGCRGRHVKAAAMTQPCGSSACCRSVGVYCDVDFPFSNLLLLCYDSLPGDYASRVYLPGTLANLGAINLVWELSSSS